MNTESSPFNLNKNNDNKILEDKYSLIVEKIISPSAEDLQIIKEIDDYLSFFKAKLSEGDSQNIQNIIFFLEAFRNFLKCSVIIYRISNHRQRRKWLASLSPEERSFFDNNRLRINKIFPLLLALDFLIIEDENDDYLQKYTSQFNNLSSEFKSDVYDKLNDQTKIELLNRLKEFCLQILVEIKKII